MSKSGVKHENYETDKINLLFRAVETAFNTDQKQDYEINVDGYKVVARTNDPEKFYTYSDLITADTKVVEFIMFKKGSASNDKFYFHIKGIPAEKETLQGLPDGMTKSEYDAKQREAVLREVHYEQLEKENEKLKAETAEKDKTIDRLNKNFEDLKAGKLLSMGEIGTNVLMGILSNPAIQKKFPILGSLSGTPPQAQTETDPEQSASFTRKGESEEEEESEEISEADRGYLILIRDLHERLTHFQMSGVMHILDILTQYPLAVGSTQKHLNNFLASRQNPQE